MSRENPNLQLRLAAFAHVKGLVGIHGEVLSAGLLRQGFRFRGEQVYLKGQQGIFKPKVLDDGAPLSITTGAAGRGTPYRDHFSEGGERLFYHYRAGNPDHVQNRWMRNALNRKLPMIYFHGVVEGAYLPVWPVFVIGDERHREMFQIAVDDAMYARVEAGAGEEHDESAEARRAYITRATRRRLHQGGFRARVLKAYRERCALCRLRHTSLLDAAHIIPDSDPRGEPVIGNGLALCKLHHAAFDRNIIGIHPDRIVQVRPDILDEDDGPMLQHGLKNLHEHPLLLPRHKEDYPESARLDERYQEFLRSIPG